MVDWKLQSTPAVPFQEDITHVHIITVAKQQHALFASRLKLRFENRQMHAVFDVVLTKQRWRVFGKTHQKIYSTLKNIPQKEAFSVVG